MDDIYSDVEFYDIVNTHTYDIPFYLKYAQQTGSPILELAAGTGRIAVPLLEKGFRYTGIDLSPEFVTASNSKIIKFGDSGKFIVGDMRKFDLHKKFNLIFIGFNSLFHLSTEEEISSFLTCVKNHLSSNGKFIIDMFVPNMSYLNRDPDKFYPVGEYKDADGKSLIVKEKGKYNPLTEIRDIDWSIYSEGNPNPVLYNFSHYMIPPERIQRLLSKAGLNIENIFGDYNENPLTKNSILQIYVCSK